jgi:hypothetical protein
MNLKTKFMGGIDALVIFCPNVALPVGETALCVREPLG